MLNFYMAQLCRRSSSDLKRSFQVQREEAQDLLSQTLTGYANK